MGWGLGVRVSELSMQMKLFGWLALFGGGGVPGVVDGEGGVWGGRFARFDNMLIMTWCGCFPPWIGLIWSS